MKTITDKIKEHASATPSKWRVQAQTRQTNKSWLRYSQGIAMRMLDRMEELGMNQKDLAENMGCSQQYISKVLKGHENLSLETISKIEYALDLQLVNEDMQIPAFDCLDA